MEFLSSELGIFINIQSIRTYCGSFRGSSGEQQSVLWSNNPLMDSSLHWNDKTKTSPVIPDLIWNPVWSNNPLMDSSIHWNDKSKTSSVIPDLIWNLLWGATIPLWIPVYTGMTKRKQALSFQT